MSESPSRVHAPITHRILAGPLALSLVLTLTASGCSPDPSPGEGGATSRVPEIAKRQQHMEDMLKKSGSKANSR